MDRLSQDAFLENERELRQALHYPPFGRLARLRVESPMASEARDRAQWLAKIIREHSPDLDLLGPSEAFLERAKGIYRWDILLKSQKINILQAAILSAKEYSHRNKWSLLVDVDPYGVG